MRLALPKTLTKDYIDRLPKQQPFSRRPPINLIKLSCKRLCLEFNSVNMANIITKLDLISFFVEAASNLQRHFSDLSSSWWRSQIDIMHKRLIFGIYLYQINLCVGKWQIINIISQEMEQGCPEKKYSKISPALKCYFLHSLYFKCMTIKDAAQRCKLNYSTAKVIIRDLSMRERKYVKRIIKQRENEIKRGKTVVLRECGYRDIIEKEELAKDQSQSNNTTLPKYLPSIQVLSRTGFDFFSRDQKNIEE